MIVLTAGPVSLVRLMRRDLKDPRAGMGHRQGMAGRSDTLPLSRLPVGKSTS